MRIVYLVLSLIVASNAVAQWESLSLPNNTSTNIASVVVDLEGDGLDEVITVSTDLVLQVLRQQPDGRLTTTPIAPLSVSGTVWSMGAADVDNNQLVDIVIAGLGFVPRVYMQQTDGSFTRETLGFTNLFAQGMNLLDIDLDGWVDAFVCNDEGQSLIYNNAQGVLSEWDLIDMTTATPSDNSGNYSSIWFDADNDGDSDLYIAKCRAGVTDPTDPRRINALFINEGGTYREAAEEFGLAVGRQSWSVSAGDLDNDGDEDLYITNHYDPDQIFINEGGIFSMIDMVDLPEHFGFQGIIADIDLNGWQDVVVLGRDAEFILYNEGLDFSVSIEPLMQYSAGISGNVVDIDDDGDLDIYKNEGLLGNDIILLNDAAASSNYIRLTAAASSAACLQTKISVYYEGGLQSQVIRAGESYGVQTSMQATFGLGASSQLDSVIVEWADGGRTTYSSLLANNHYLLYPDGCLGQYLPPVSESYTLCAGEVVEVSAPGGYTNYQWSNGSTERTVLLTQGQYNATLTDDSGCQSISKPFAVYYSTLDEGVIDISATSICNQEPITVAIDEYFQALWGDGSTEQERVLSGEGLYYISVSDDCGQMYNDSIQAVLLVAAPLIDTTHIINEAQAVSFTMPWDVAVRDDRGRLRYRGRSVDLGLVSADTAVFVSSHTIADGRVSLLGDTMPSTSYASDLINSGMVFDVEKSLRLKRVDVRTDTPGPRRFQIYRGEDLLWSDEINLTEGVQPIDIDLFLEEGSYILTTDGAFNQSLYGFTGPRLARTAGASFPYIGDGITLTRTLNGTTNYYFYYNWQVETDLAICESPPSRFAVEIATATESVVQDQVLAIYPNPTTDVLHLSADVQSLRSATIVDLLGRHYPIKVSSQTIDVSHLPAGTYRLQLIDDKNLKSALFVKI